MNMIPKTPLEKPLPPALDWRKTIPNLFYVEEGFLLWFWKSDTFRLSLRWQLTMGCCCNGSVTNWAQRRHLGLTEQCLSSATAKQNVCLSHSRRIMWEIAEQLVAHLVGGGGEKQWGVVVCLGRDGSQSEDSKGRWVPPTCDYLFEPGSRRSVERVFPPVCFCRNGGFEDW